MLRLRELARSDMAEINSWRASRELISTLGAPYRFIGREIDEGWFDGYLSSRANCVRCVAVDADEPGRPMSLVTLAAIDWVSRSCELHVMVGEEFQGRGVGRFSVGEILEHAFGDLGMHRVELGVLEDNARARSLYESVGFKSEGVKRSAIFKNGVYKDLHIMALLASERS